MTLPALQVNFNPCCGAYCLAPRLV